MKKKDPLYIFLLQEIMAPTETLMWILMDVLQIYFLNTIWEYDNSSL